MRVESSRFTRTFKYKSKTKQNEQEEKQKSRVVRLKPRCRSSSSNQSWTSMSSWQSQDQKPPIKCRQVGGARQLVCLFFFLIGGLLTSCIGPCLLFSSFSVLNIRIQQLNRLLVQFLAFFQSQLVSDVSPLPLGCLWTDRKKKRRKVIRELHNAVYQRKQ